jgi:hypothetical protein
MKQNNKQFIAAYKAAVKAKLNRCQLAFILEKKPDTISRDRLRVLEKFSMNLPILPLGTDYSCSDEKLALFHSYLNEILVKSEKTPIKKFDKKRYVITSAQNATEVHTNFLQCLHTYINHNDAQLIIIPYRYKNPSAVTSVMEQNNDWWVESIKEFLCDSEIVLHPTITVMGHIKITPTATVPLSSMEGETGSSSAIYGHPKIQLMTVPTPSKLLPKILTTTGSITVQNYSDSKTGHKGYFHHSFSAIVVEIDEYDNPHIRHIHADDVTGAFYDCDKYYTATEVTENHRAAGLITGDSHAIFADPSVVNATFRDKKSIVNTLRPQYVIYHDILDFYSRNHHHKDDLQGYSKILHKRDCVEAELQITADFIDENTHPDVINVIVKSNHDEALSRWLREADIRKDPANGRFFHYMRYHQFKNVEKTETGFTTIDARAFRYGSYFILLWGWLCRKLYG